jgi:microcin C transport system substrate-binding protein
MNRFCKLVSSVSICFSLTINAATIETSTLYTFGEPKYSSDFSHLEYVNPKAPKTGTVTFAATGTYDNFNRYSQRGNFGANVGSLYDGLMYSPNDEINVSYGLIGQTFRYPDDFSWMEVDVHPDAKFHDGQSITAHDIEFTHQKFIDQGVPQYKTYYQDVKSVIALNDKTARIEMVTPNKDKLFSLVQGMTVLPKHYWMDKNLSEPLKEPPLSSGAYKISDYKLGQSITYSLVEDYWATNHPLNVGRNNFTTIIYDYYRDETVKLEAFKAGEFDLRQENTAKFWATSYTGSNFDKGYIKKETISHAIPQSMQGFIYNIERDVFKDIKVREALSYLFDFEWMNKNMFYDQYARTSSYFQNTQYQAQGTPSAQELEWLEPVKDLVPQRVFKNAYVAPITDGSGRIRSQMRQATSLLKEAGWEVQDGVITNIKTGEPLTFELLAYSPPTARIIVPFQNNLKNMGIELKIRMVDTTQYQQRFTERNYDMIFSSFSANAYPSTSLEIVWNSNYIDSSYNKSGVQDKAVDYLTEQITQNQQQPEALKALGPALDRVLTWNFYAIPAWHLGAFRVATWDKFSRPAVRPKYDLGIDTWWVDVEKAQRLPEKRR